MIDERKLKLSLKKLMFDLTIDLKIIQHMRRDMTYPLAKFDVD